MRLRGNDSLGRHLLPSCNKSKERSRKGGNMAKLTPIKAIRAKCLDCSNGQFKEVRLCPVKNCPLYEYRNGHRPKGEEMTAENDSDEK